MDRKKDSKRTNERFIPSRIFHSSFFYHFLSVSYQFDIRFLSFCNPSFSYILSRFSALMSIPTRKKKRKQNSTEGLAPKKKNSKNVNMLRIFCLESALKSSIIRIRDPAFYKPFLLLNLMLSIGKYFPTF